MRFFIYITFISLLLLSKELITPIPTNTDLNKEKIKLGKLLFFDVRLSKDNTISCSSCHDIFNGGDDGRVFSIGVDGLKGDMNSPTVLNSRYNFTQFWDGRAKNLEEQAVGPIHNPVEMNSDFNEIINKLSKDIQYSNQFFKIYKTDITKEAIIDAIVEFEKSLITPNSKFDLYLKGDKSILSERELRGFELFKAYGCISCHNGINIGGNLFQKIGIIVPYTSRNSDNLGRYNVTKNEEDKYYFKVPTLRNIELTAPYLHDGSEKDLKGVIKTMIKYQVGSIYEDRDIEDIELFLKTLTAKIKLD